MKQFYTILILVFFGTQIMAQDLSISGTITDEDGNAIAGHAVLLQNPDPLFSYSNTVYTNENGAFSDLVELGEMTQGEIIASTESCDGTVSQSQFFNPGNYALIFDFEICNTGGGNDCQNDFNYAVEGLSVNLNGWEVNGNEVELYSWSFGDGSGAEGQTATHEYASTGEYLITLTTTVADDCEAVTSKWVNVSNNTGDATLWGQVFIGNAFLDYGTASIYTITSDTVGGDDFVLFAETQVDLTGKYIFTNVPEGNYLILVQADANSVYYNSTLPTYYGDVIYWVDATIIVLGEPANPYNINLQTATGANSGEGQINGDLVGDGFKKKLIDGNVTLFLLDENNNPLELTYSEIDENFDFSNIAFGDYVIYAEVIGLPTEATNITLNTENPTANIEIVISPNGVTTGIEDNYTDVINSIFFPNPVDSYARIDLNMLENAQVEMIILNQLGQVISNSSKYMTQGINKVELNTQSYPSGLYFMQIKTPKTTLNNKFIKR